MGNAIISRGTDISNKADINHKHSSTDITSGTLPINRGGTGATTAASVLTNLGLTATATELNYVGGVTSNIQTQINTMKSNFQDGCEKIAEAITAEGISTATTASPQTMATNIGKIRSGGNATAGNILSGKTAYSGKSYITGTMINQGAKTLTPAGNYTVTFGEGYYSSVTADGTAAYEAGRNLKKLIRKELNFTYEQGYVTDIEGYKTFTVDNFAICECKLTLQTWAQGTPTAKTTTLAGATLSYNSSTGNIVCTYQAPVHYINGSTQKMAAKASLNIKMVLYYVG